MSDEAEKLDGVHGMVPRERMCEGARKLRDTYAITPGAPFVQREFGYYCLEQWAEQGMPEDVPRGELFGYDPAGKHAIGGLGWCEAGFSPCFETKVLEDRGEHELVQDFAGRHVLCFKGRRSGFMPEYVDHPVKDMKTWEENCKWRMNPDTPERYEKLDEQMDNARAAAGQGMMIAQHMVGGYMYLRSLIGPGDLLYKFYDEPELIHDCMQTWLKLAQAVISRHQEYVTLDELFIAEDICYNNGPLISPDMMREFLFPYYQEVISAIKSRQIDKDRHLYFQVDTDGWATPTIPVYGELGMDVMSPFEVASGCDVVEIGQQYPDLVMTGGIDKRILAKSKEAIDEMVDRIFPAMQARGGYIPTCDHGVPEEVSYENYLHYRKRALEFA
ncbi:MAG: uroporphyrinogen decarboxylase family protein [Kiritimatiellia bacterium]|jgi:uroporphyrinogen decarboxylase|nr:uroporphyrinogen decarboxylase family protein [Kiritimatiellia bacterium]MDP6631671.1 uroporphyrinogen decarboxylase family protein [Kiritimatiellia bacterium]MDP6810769.1 uroporphyrinogen decarboxylase family protein [Kiritimatiellia bacterium]MDP7022644.1 uroporphyrinogen decarboxylase family protein [Kiritimatiellia bacterium]